MDSPSQPPVKKSRSLKNFQHQWFDDHPEWKTWVKPCEIDASKWMCVACKVTLSCGLSEIKRHSLTASHLKKITLLKHDRELGSFSNPAYPEEEIAPYCSQPITSTSSSSEVYFNDRVRLAEIRYARFLAENNIPISNAPEILNLFKAIGREPAILQAMQMGKTKATNLINKVISVEELQRVVEILKKVKFSVYVDETSDIRNDKWMTLMVRYVDPDSLMVENKLLQLIPVDATDCSAERLFSEFNNAVVKKGIPLDHIIGLASDNASVMVGKKKSFEVFMTRAIPNLITLPGICHSLAIVAGKACSMIPDEIHRIIRSIPSFINGSPKRLKIFKQFQAAFGGSSQILRLVETRWLSRQQVVSSILPNWRALEHFLIQQSSEKVTQAGEWLDLMNKPMTKAYLLFLQFALDFFNKINANFQSNDTLIHHLQASSKNFLLEILKKFIKPALLDPYIFDNEARNIDFEDIANQRGIFEVDIGAECDKYLQVQQSLGIASEVEITQFRANCLKFYAVGAREARRTLSFDDEFLADLTVFSTESALLDSNRECSLHRVNNVCRRLNISYDKGIDEEWRSLYCVDVHLKGRWCELSFDEMWMAICTFANSDGIVQFPSLRLLMGMIRALPHSNAPAERAFSLIPDTKTKKRNSLNSESLNSICVLRASAKSKKRGELDLASDLNCLRLWRLSDMYAESKKPESAKMNVLAYESDDEWAMDVSSRK